jgi:imidazolonepropionase-like amidohydrolase
MKIRSIDRIALTCLILGIVPVIAAGAPLVIEGGTLIDGNGGPPVEDALIIIDGKRIETVARKGRASYPAGAQVLEADGKFVLPGLHDAHCHYQWWMPELFLNHGVTSGSLTGMNTWSLATREAIERGKIPGPRLLLQGPTVRGAWREGLEPVDSDNQTDTPDEAVEAVRRTLPDKPASVSVMRGVTYETYKAAIDEAHRANVPVVAQAIGPHVYAREAILAGADILEHAAGVTYSILKDSAKHKWKNWGEIEEHSLSPVPFADMDEQIAAELIELAVARNVYLEPDLIAMGRGFHKRIDEYELQALRLYNDYRLSYVPEGRRIKETRVYREFDILEPDERELRNRGYQNMVRFMKMYHDAGGKLLAGTDCSSWAIPGITMHHELDVFVNEVGLTPMEAIVTATRNPAEAWRVLDEQGTIEEGKLAALFVVNADPLEDIRNTQNIEWVIKDGEIVNNGYHPWFDSPLKNFYSNFDDHTEALKERMEKGIRHRTGLRDVGPAWSFGAPMPGIERTSPRIVTEGDSTFTLTLKGVGFMKKSVVYMDEDPLPTEFVNDYELRAIVDESKVRAPGTFRIRVKNIDQFAAQPHWGGTTSLPKPLIVNFKYE